MIGSEGCKKNVVIKEGNSQQAATKVCVPKTNENHLN